MKKFIIISTAGECGMLAIQGQGEENDIKIKIKDEKAGGQR